MPIIEGFQHSVNVTRLAMPKTGKLGTTAVSKPSVNERGKVEHRELFLERSEIWRWRNLFEILFK
jgi:hypothetical protein